jgi:hypothetical protein
MRLAIQTGFVGAIAFSPQRLEALGQPVVIENRPDASGARETRDVEKILR